MKIDSMILAVLMMGFAGYGWAQEKVNVAIKGSCDNSFPWVYVFAVNKTGVAPIDSVQPKNGSFSFNVSAEPNEVIGVGGLNYYMPFFADGVPVEIDLVNHTLKGSPQNVELSKVDLKMDSIGADIQSKIDDLKAQLMKEPQRQAELSEQAYSIIKDNTEKMLSILRGHRESLIPVVYLPSLGGQLDFDDLKPFMDPSKPYYSHPLMENVIAEYNGMLKKQPGSPFINFSQPDMEGRMHSLSEWCGKGNYVLVDFWASWCGPCRKEMPTVIETYNMYHNKANYEVIGVSLDMKAEAWKTAVKSMGMAWPQLSDLKGWDCEASRAYSIEAIPANILFDPEGKVVATDLRGEELKAVLADIFGK